MAGPSEYVRSLGLTPLVIHPLTPKLFLKQVPHKEGLRAGEREANTLGKTFLVTAAEIEGPALVLLHTQSNTRDVFLPLSKVSAMRHLTEFERSQSTNQKPIIIQDATALHLSISGNTHLGGPRDIVIWSPDPLVGKELEKYLVRQGDDNDDNDI